MPMPNAREEFPAGYRDAKIKIPSVARIVLLLGWAALVLFLWSAYQGNWTLALPLGALLVASLVYDLIAGRASLKVLAWAFGGGMVGLAVCFAMGFSIVAISHPPGAEYVGFGIEPWNIPGTLAAVAIWVAMAIVALRRKSRGRRTEQPN
jgi:hypothetical protein